MTLSEMTKSLLSTKDFCEEGMDWTAAMMDALLYDAIERAAKDGGDPEKYCLHLLQAMQERADTWLDAVRSGA